MSTLRDTIECSARRSARSLGLAALLLGLSAGPAPAAPEFEIELTRDEADYPVVYRSDERTDYTVKVTNTAPNIASVGETLTCDARSGSPNWFEEPTFTFQWVSNGAPASGPTATPTPTTSTYVVQAADAGGSLQCKVTGTNAGGAAASFSLPLGVNPSPSPGLAAYSGTGVFRPNVTGPLAGQRTCTPPTTWTGSPTWSFQWLRNGVPIPGATSNTYTPQVGAGQEDELKVLQCMVIGKTGSGEAPSGGTIVMNSGISPTAVRAAFETAFGAYPPNNNSVDPKRIPLIVSGNSTSGPVTVELELPGGLGTYADRFFDTKNTQKAPGSEVEVGWSCSAVPALGLEPAKAICERSDPLSPGGTSYPTFSVGAALGADLPDTFLANAKVSGGGAVVSAGDTYEFTFAPDKGFGIEAFETIVPDEVGEPFTQAGGHPLSASAVFSFNTTRALRPESVNTPLFPIDSAKTILTDTPRGFVGNALAVPELCPRTEDIRARTCPPGSAVGGIDLFFPGNLSAVENLVIYALEPEFGRPALFAFVAPDNGLYVFYPRLRAENSYAITFESAPLLASFPRFLSVDVTLCSFGTHVAGASFAGCKEATDPTANPQPLVTLPTRCEGPPPTTVLKVDSWQNPGEFDSKAWSDPPTTGCDKVKFEPTMDLNPTSHRADSPTGMDVEIEMPTDGLTTNTGISQANLKRVRVTLPEGMAVNASAGHGLNPCTAAQVGIDPDTGIPDNNEPNCPDNSKIGTIAIDTPLIQEPLEGFVYIAKQGKDNPFDSNVALYMVFSSKKDGVTIKVAGEVKPDPRTGQMTITFDENPQAPFERVELHFPQGPRANLVNPPKCGTYEIKAEMTPWTALDPDNPTPAETVTQTSSYEVTEGPNGGPCPEGKLDPKLNAGTESPVAGKTSPFVFRLSREDGTDRFTALSLKTPKGLTAYLKGVPYCPDAVLNSIPSAPQTGQGEIDNPSCPKVSQIGTATAAAGAGSLPLFVDTGKAYLAGPYKGAPISIAVVAPAVAGPLDLGNVVVRNALHLDPESAQVSVVSDPVPTILHGLLLGIKDIRVAIDRPGFTLNPTSCEVKSVDAEIKGQSGATVSVSNRFQVGGCESLAFKPRLTARLFGGTKRGGHPSLKGVLTAGPGEAGIARAAVTVPRSEFLDQAHIRTICTRVQFAAKECPKASIYGHASAITPLLDYPVSGPVYLRSSNNKLPDLVVALRGPDYQPIEAVVVGRVDSIKGQIRTTFESTPDVPLTKFTLQMQGGKKGLLVNSRDVCSRTYRATVKMEGHNGMTTTSRPALKNSCGKARKAKKRRAKHGR